MSTAQHAPEVTAADLDALDALLASETALFAAGYRAGHADGLMQADREVSEVVRRMIRDLDSWGWGGL